jgi:hypothetical protein
MKLITLPQDVRKIVEVSAPYEINVAEIRIAGQMALGLIAQSSLDAFARLDSKAAVTNCELQMILRLIMNSGDSSEN